jgi:hypothetical protein
VYAHRTISSLAVIAATAGVAVGGAATAQAGTAQAVTAHHRDQGSNAKRKARRSAPLQPLLAFGKATPSRWTIGPCAGAGPLARHAEFIKSTTGRKETQRRNRLSTNATCIGVIEY